MRTRHLATLLPISLAATLLVFLLLVIVALPAPGVDAFRGNVSCIFQLRFRADSLGEDAVWPQGRSLQQFIDVLLRRSYPTLNATAIKQWNEEIFNVTRVDGVVPGSDGDIDPYVGCRAMLATIFTGSPVTIAQDYNVTDAWVGFRPVRVPQYLRITTPPPEGLYTALGVTGAVLIVVQLGYGVWHWWSNRGTLEALVTD
jgi:hypothetical protein